MHGQAGRRPNEYPVKSESTMPDPIVLEIFSDYI